MTHGLADRSCEPCHGGTPALRGNALEPYREALAPRWRIVEEHHLQATFEFPDFRSALSFTNRVGALAEEEGHHPDLELARGRVGVRIWTHAIGALSENDFILAAKIDRIAG